MPNLTISIARAQDRIKQSQKDIVAVTEILAILNTIQKIAEQKEVDAETVLKKLCMLAKKIASMNIRQGSLAVRHPELPWKHLSFLDSALTQLECRNKAESRALVITLIQSPDFKVLQDNFALFLQDETENLAHITKIHQVLQHQLKTLIPLKENLKKITEDLVHYKHIYSLLNNAQAAKSQKNSANAMEKITSYCNGNLTQPPEFIKILWNTYAARLGNPEDVKVFTHKMLCEKIYIEEHINKFSNTLEKMERGTPLVLTDPFTRLPVIEKKLEEIEKNVEKN